MCVREWVGKSAQLDLEMEHKRGFTHGRLITMTGVLPGFDETMWEKHLDQSWLGQGVRLPW